MLYFIEVDKKDNFEEYSNYMIYLVAEKRQLISRLNFDIDKKLSLFSDLFIRYIACNTLCLPNRALSFYKTSCGKPYLSGFPDFQFNISHTRNAIIIAISQEEIGVDIEKIAPADLKIAERFFTKNELRFVLSENIKSDELFYEIWTKKEAYLKWLGKGLSLPLNGFDVTSIDVSSMLKAIRINEYIASLCCRDNHYNEADIVKMKEKHAVVLFDEIARSSYFRF